MKFKVSPKLRVWEITESKLKIKVITITLRQKMLINLKRQNQIIIKQWIFTWLVLRSTITQQRRRDKSRWKRRDVGEKKGICGVSNIAKQKVFYSTENSFLSHFSFGWVFQTTEESKKIIFFRVGFPPKQTRLKLWQFFRGRKYL